MIGARKVVCAAAALFLVLAVASAPAKAQLAGFGGSGGGDMMTQMAPMLEMMKAKMGKKRFATMMRTMGPMMSGMMDGGGGLSGMLGGGGIPGGFGGGAGFAPESYGVGMGGGDVMGMLGGGGGGEMMSMIPQLMQMAHFGGGHGRRHHRRHS
jgi:hypothetical protein